MKKILLSYARGAPRTFRHTAGVEFGEYPFNPYINGEGIGSAQTVKQGAGGNLVAHSFYFFKLGGGFVERHKSDFLKINLTVFHSDGGVINIFGAKAGAYRSKAVNARLNDFFG